jgi:release factor glutamine methyltransferase
VRLHVFESLTATDRNTLRMTYRTIIEVSIPTPNLFSLKNGIRFTKSQCKKTYKLIMDSLSMDIYEPQEDSELVKRNIKEFAKGSILDMGTGSGILAVEAAKYADTVMGLDINEKAIQYCKEHIFDPKILFFKSNLFEILEQGKITRTFDLIIFNPPYLPKEKPENIALDGGKEGHEVIDEFLKKAKKHLNPDGKILLLFSSLSKKPKIDLLLDKLGYKKSCIDRMKVSFETLYVYLVEV